MSNNKVIKLKRRKRINIGTIIFLFVIIYLFGSAIYYKNKIRISIYEVTEENLSKDMSLTGVIVRDETVCYTTDSGYINYYLPDGHRVKKASKIYSVDENRSVYDMLGVSSEVVFKERDMAELKRMIAGYNNQFDGSRYSTVYEWKTAVTSYVNELADETLLDEIEKFVTSTGVENNLHFSFVTSDRTGIISYTSDSLDGLTAEMVNSSVFSQEEFSSTSLRKTLQYSAGDPVYKLITSDSWQIVCPVTMEQYVLLNEKKNLKFRIEQDGFVFTAPVSFDLRGSDYYMTISLTKYGANYLKDRFLSLSILLNEDKGLKIPTSAIVTKDFYLIPPEYFTIGGDSNARGLTIVTYDSQTGEPQYQFQQTQIYYEDEEAVYISKDSFPAGTLVYSAELADSMTLSKIGTLEGVYNVNRGYAIFRRIERIAENEGYVIIKKGTANGVARYDHIALNADEVTESSVIY